jgi:hypothetical protein
MHLDKFVLAVDVAETIERGSFVWKIRKKFTFKEFLNIEIYI